MKRIITILLAVMVCMVANAQSLTQKYNSLMDRTEFFDSYGHMVGYAKYNKLMERIEYYDQYGHLVKYEQDNLSDACIPSSVAVLFIKARYILISFAGF